MTWLDKEKQTVMNEEPNAAGMLAWTKCKVGNRYLWRERVRNRKKKKNKKKPSVIDKVNIKYECNDIFTFDIETTSFFVDKETGEQRCYEAQKKWSQVDGKWQAETLNGYDEQYWNSCDAYSIPYEWSFCMNDQVYFGRDLRAFEEILKQFSRDTHVIIYVHNLSFEFRFLINFLDMEVFARDTNAVIKCIPIRYPNIEFRCSYMLTTLSLAAWGADLGFNKMVGDLEYNKMRTPYTAMTDTEYGYCKRDVEVVARGIQNYVKQYIRLRDIPLTGTGEVRGIFKDIVKKKKALHDYYVSLLPGAALYCGLKTAFAGGYTHANELWANKNVRIADGELGYHYDFTSSYPFVMISEKFPSGTWQKATFDKTNTDKYAYLLRVRFHKCVSKCSMHYISVSKCFDTRHILGYSKQKKINGLTVDNGRLVSNETEFGFVDFDMYITEQDFDIIEQTYDIDYDIVECVRSMKQYLPEEFIRVILQLYGNKTSFKGVSGKEEIYAQSKRHVNGVYGCFVMKLVDAEVDFANGKWSKEDLTFSDIKERLLNLQHENYGVWNSYAQGVWITAYARHNLWECILQCPDDVMYCDTDSIFLVKKYDFSDYNAKVINKMRDMCDYFHNFNQRWNKQDLFDYSMCSPRTPAGVEKPLGIFDLEDTFTEFKTLGAKRYVYRPADGKHAGELCLTVSGINKGAVDILDDNIENFSNKLVFDRDHPAVHRNLVKYVEMDNITVNEGEYDEYDSDWKYGIVIRPTSYTMGIDDFENYLSTLTTEQHDVLFDL